MKPLDDILEHRGPLTGKELLRETGSDEFTLWFTCRRQDSIITRVIGKRYLRLDRQVEDYARLSPSIRREFHGYTVIGIAAHAQEVAEKAALLEAEIAAISQRKFALAQKVISRLVEAHPASAVIQERACFMIAGDVVYGMAHGEPRPEPSIGELVRGSDLDIMIVVEELPQLTRESLDAAIYKEKYDLLLNPGYREELDYILKDTARVREQLSSGDFRSLVAAKILHEARFLAGSRDLFARVKAMLQEHDIPRKMERLESLARLNRERAEVKLLARTGPPDEAALKFFHTAEEKEEFF